MQDEIIDPVADLINSVSDHNNKIHIRIKQRNAKKYITFIEQLPTDINLSLLLKEMKKTLHCNGSIQKTENGEYIQLFGDQRETVKKFLLDNKISDNINIIIHGY